MSADAQCIVTLRLQNLPISITCHITPLPSEITMVLVDKRLRAHNAYLDLGQGSCTLTKGYKRHVLSNYHHAAGGADTLAVLVIMTSATDPNPAANCVYN